MLTLRPYQIEALQSSKEKYKAGIRRQLIALPTGTGKTVIFANVKQFHALPGRVLVVVHRQELVMQAHRAFRKWCNGKRIGIEMGNDISCSQDEIVIASVQSLGRTGSGRIRKFGPEDFGVVICDEAHHSVANTYLNVFRHFGFLDGTSKALLLGVTATPVRSDGKGLSGVFDDIVYEMSICDAVLNGWLVDIKGYRARTSTALDGVSVKKSGDFDEVELAKTVNTETRNALVLKTWSAYAKSRQSIVFCVDIQHSKDMAATFRSAGIRSAAIWGEDPDRKEKLDRHQRGDLQVLTNCEVLTEGYDDSKVSCIVMARPTQSEVLFVQMAGRGTRIPNDVRNLLEARATGQPLSKDDCLIIDVVDNTSKHSLVTLPTLFGFPKDHDFRGSSAIRSPNRAKHTGGGKPARAAVVSRVKPTITEVDLLGLAKRSPLLKGSVLQWYLTAGGDLVLPLPGHNCFRLRKSDRGWRVVGELGKASYISQPLLSVLEACKEVERAIRTRCPELLRSIERERSWPDEKMTPLQMELAHTPTTQLSTMSRAQAQEFLASRFAARFQGRVVAPEAMSFRSDRPQDVAPSRSAQSCAYPKEWFATVLNKWSVEKSPLRFILRTDSSQARIFQNRHGRWGLEVVKGSDRTTKWFWTSLQALARAEEALKGNESEAQRTVAVENQLPATRMQIEFLRTVTRPPKHLSFDAANVLLERMMSQVLSEAAARRTGGSRRAEGVLR